MARLRKINGSYYSYWYDRDRSPKEKSYPLRCSRQDVARRRLRKLEEAHANGRFDPWKGGWLHEHLSCTEAVRRFLDHKEGSVRERTLDTYEQQLTAWTDTLPAGLNLRDAKPEHLRRYIFASGISTASKRKRHRHLKMFLRWAKKEGLLEESPLQEIRPPKRERKTPEFLTANQLERLLRAIDADYEMKRKEKRARPGQIQWLKDCIILAVNTGMRRGELVNLRWEDVCFETEMITVRNRDDFRTKGGDERRIPFTPESRSLLNRLREEWPDALPTDPVLRSYTGRQVSADYLSRRFKHYVRLAKLDERFTFHSLRHTTASWLVQKGVSLPVVQAILGHSNISVTERYAHLAPDVMRAAMEQAFAGR